MNRLQKLFAFKSCRDLTIGEIFNHPKKYRFVHLPQARGAKATGLCLPATQPDGMATTVQLNRSGPLRLKPCSSARRVADLHGKVARAPLFKNALQWKFRTPYAVGLVT